MRQWWGMRRRGHTLSSKTQLVANDTTFSARGPGLRLQTRGHNGLNYGFNVYALESTNKDTHTLAHTCAVPKPKHWSAVWLGFIYAKDYAMYIHWKWNNIKNKSPTALEITITADNPMRSWNCIILQNPSFKSKSAFWLKTWFNSSMVK